MQPHCPSCGTANRAHSRFCCVCGCSLPPEATLESATLLATDRSHSPPIVDAVSGERKLVTILFSDLSGYSALFEHLDPEDVGDIMNAIFGVVSEVVTRYEGCIDRIIGDEVLAVFGIPTVHEDDPIRAVHAALEIHAAIARLECTPADRLQRPLRMHSGIASGVVVTGMMDLTTGRHGITGETVNRARLYTNLAGAGEIVVGYRTMTATCGFFVFDAFEPPSGRPVPEGLAAFRVLDIGGDPVKIHRVRGLRARLIGREDEMDCLAQALAAVDQGGGRCVCLAGEAGTGKSRLIMEFRRRLIDRGVQWLQGNAFPYTQGTPYFPLNDLLGRVAGVRENDAEQTIRKKLRLLLDHLDMEDDAPVHILERLFIPPTEKAVRLTPGTWKLRLQRSLIDLIAGQAQRGTTVICLEDLHWADPSTINLLGNILATADLGVLFLISYRPGQVDADAWQWANPYYAHSTINVSDLSPEMGRAMLASLLGTDQAPPEVLSLVDEQLGGNPFYIEEAVNALVDAGSLQKEDGAWRIADSIPTATVSTSIASVIDARLDQLSEAAKRIIQEASVIGRRFPVALLKKISEHPERVDSSLAVLKAAGLVRDCGDPVEVVCRFKHALVHETAYNGLLKRQRRDLHERIAQTLERERLDRIDVRYEALAYHFSRGRSIDRAVAFLRQSGLKSLKKYAVVEAHDHFARAYRLLMHNPLVRPQAIRTQQTVRLLLEWFLAFNVRGRYQAVLDLFLRHAVDAMQCADLSLKGMYLAYRGWIYQRREQLDRSRQDLLQALAIGRRINNPRVIAYACAGLIWTRTDQGRFDEALAFADQSEAAAGRFLAEAPHWSFDTDPNLARLVFTGSAITHWFRGDCRQCHRIAERLLAYGDAHGDANSISEGHLAHAMGDFAAGRFQRCLDNCRLAIDTAADAMYALNARFLMAYAHLALEQADLAESNFRATTRFCDSSGYEYIGSSAETLSVVIDVAKGNLCRGIRVVKAHTRHYREQGKRYHAQSFHFLLGQIYRRLAMREGSMTLLTALKNLPFLIANLPRAAANAEHHFQAAIGFAEQIQSRGVHGQACYELALLYRAQGRRRLARQRLEAAIALFEPLGAVGHLENARNVLAALEDQSTEAVPQGSTTGGSLS